MQAEIFSVKKIPCNYGERSYKIRGKDYDDLLANIPKYNQKISETESDLAKTTSSDRDAAMDEYRKFKDILLARDKQPDFTQSEEDGFKDRMKLRRYDSVILDTVYFDFGSLVENDPIDWLDYRNAIYRYIQNSISLNYVQPSHLRLRKVISNTDYCAQLADSLRTDPGWARGSAKNAHDLVFRCYDIFPYSDGAAKKTFDLIFLMMDLYVFSNYTTNGMGADVVYEKVEEQVLQFDSNQHFHDYIERTISRMNDAHISYKVDCYEQFTFVQPIFMKYLGVIIITEVSTVELQEWVGAEVLAIDTVNAFHLLIDYGNQLGKSHFLYSRLFLGMSKLFFESSSQDFRLDRGLYLKRTKIPPRRFISYLLRKPGSNRAVEVNIDWLVFKNPTLVDFEDQYSYWNRNCEAKPLKRIVKATTNTLQRRSSGALIPFNRNIKKRSQVQKRTDTTIYKATTDGMIPIAIGPGFAFFILNDPKYGDYGVLVIHTFDTTDMESWFKNMRLGFTNLMDKGITNLLLDLTGNSGGTLCLAYTLLGVLSPSANYPFPATEFSYGTRNMPTNSLRRISTCTNEANIKQSPFRPQCFTNLETRNDFTDEYNWGSNFEVKPKVLKGLIRGYTQFGPFLMDKCLMKSTPLLADIKPNFEKIILVSDGLCGSSCAIVAAYLHQHGSPTIILSVNNMLALAPNMYSFAGGQVVNFNNIKDVARRSSCFDMIPNILESTQMTITYRAIFNIEDKITPLEFSALPAKQVIEYNTDYANSYAARWKDFFPRGCESPDEMEMNFILSLDGDLSACEGSNIFC